MTRFPSESTAEIQRAGFVPRKAGGALHACVIATPVEFVAHPSDDWALELVRMEVLQQELSSGRGLVSAQTQIPESHAIGVPYPRANEEVSTDQRSPFTVDPDVVDRSLRGHNRTQNLLNDLLTSRGIATYSSKPGAIGFDLLWHLGTSTCVAEVKSLSTEGETQQLRLGLGQVLEYRQRLGTRLQTIVRAVLVVEREPSDPSWGDICTAAMSYLSGRRIWFKHFPQPR